MAKKSAVEKNKNRRTLVDKYEAKRKALKAHIMDRDADTDTRFQATMQLAQLPRNSARIRIRNRCEMTGRPRAYYRKLHLSRIALRSLASQGLIPGMSKSSW